MNQRFVNRKSISSINLYIRSCGDISILVILFYSDIWFHYSKFHKSIIQLNITYHRQQQKSTDKINLTFHRQNKHKMLNEQSLTRLQQKYIMEQDGFIGQGSYATVVKGRQKQTGRPVAIKIIKKQKMNEQQQILLEREIYIMKHIHHPNIVEFYDYYTDKKNIYLVLEYLAGGELYQEIVEKETYTEEEARNIISPIIDAIRYLHQCGIVHRDLKPENCVYTSKSQDRLLKLIDFGVSQTIPNDTHLLSTAVGTPLYMAPEILQGAKYGEVVDWWSIGVILYVLLCGYPPFQSDNQVDLKTQIFNNGIKFDDNDWKNISPQAKDMVMKLLTIDPQKRITADKIMDHPWMTGQTSKKVLKNVQGNIKKFSNKLRVIRNAIKAVRIMQSLPKLKSK